MLSRLKIEEGWFTVFLTWSLVFVAAVAIVDAELIEGTSVLPLIGTMGVLAGLALAKSRFSGRTAFILTLIYGIFIVTFLIGRTLPGDLPWRERAFELISRQVVWLDKAVSQSSSRDGLIFVVQTGAIFWLLGVSAAWYTFRNQKVWRVVLPSGLVLLSVIYYYFGPKPLVAFLALYALLALIYIARTHLVSKERGWKAASVRYEKSISFTFLQASLLAALIALGVAWGLPAAGANAAVSDALNETGWDATWKDFQDNWTRLFASLRSYGAGTNDPFRDTLSLGGPRTVGDSLIMDVYVAQKIPYVYWQAVAYDTYDGGRWSISESDQVLRMPDDGRFEVADYELREDLVQNFINYVPNSGTMYAAPGPVEGDRQMFVTWGRHEEAARTEVLSVQSRFILRQGEQYGVTSHYSVADAESLRSDGTDYPQWIIDKYLQVPDEITAETRDLAVELTTGHDNAFDKAIAVRNYLRDNIAYNDQIPAPPDGLEPVHYVLFERQEAYCNYYASAMIMMLRSQGIPARFVAGYTQGEWDEESKSYRVRASNAHAWTEVYFPAYGWIPFEATASIPAGDRPDSSGNPGDAFGDQRLFDDTTPQLEDDLAPTADEFDFGSDPSQLELDPTGGRSANYFLQAGIAAALLAIAAVALLLFNRANRQVESSVLRSYLRLANWAPWLGVLIQPAHTPYERADLLSDAVPDGKEPLHNLTHQFVRQQFSRDRSADESFDSREEWRMLRPAMIRRTLAFQLRQLRGMRLRRPRRRKQTRMPPPNATRSDRDRS